MIRIDIAEQTAVELHNAVSAMREVFATNGLADAESAMRDSALAIAGGLRAAGWTPVADGWAKRAVRSRR